MSAIPAITMTASTITVLAGAGPDPRCGPFATDFATLVRAHRGPLRAALDRHDVAAAAVGAERSGWVVTHGEAKPNNTMLTTAGSVLVDWDTVRLAPAARDVWLTGSVDAYTAATGRQVPADQIDFYRRRWDLKDLCGSAGWFTAPHQRTTDTELAWHGSIQICRRLSQNPG